MRFWDKGKLIIHEYRYEKSEWIVSLILQCLLFVCIFFLFILSKNISGVFSDYLKPAYVEGYCFSLVGYNNEDLKELEKKGFYDITFSEDGNGYAMIDSLDKIWSYKVRAVFEGKDIWDEGLDQILSVLFFCKITLLAIGVIILVVMISNLSNSFSMKLYRRNKYINMLQRLGCDALTVKSIFYGVFGMRNCIAIVIATLVNMVLIELLNKYMLEKMYISSSFPVFDVTVLLIIVVISTLLMLISFAKRWRENEV